MTRSIQINELREPYWKLLTALLTGLAVILFIIFWNMSDVFWSGIVRFASFISFSAAVLSGLKVMEGNLNMELQVTGKTLSLFYRKKGKKVLEDSHELDNIKSISCIKSSSFLSSRQENVFVVRFKDSDQDYELFHFGGRMLKVSNEEADRLIRFFEEHDIPLSDRNKN